MRPSARQLARYFEPGTPTGLAGLWTHATPRSTLLYLYGTMLSKLQTIPESSLYRQSVEAVAKQRMGLVEQIVPPGYQEWAAKAQALLKDKPGQFKIESGLKGGSGVKTVKMGDRVFVIGTKHKAADVREEEWDGEPMGAIDLRAVDEDTVQELQAMGHFETRGEETTVEEDGSVSREHGKENAVDKDESQIKWESEPQLTPEQYVSSLLFAFSPYFSAPPPPALRAVFVTPGSLYGVNTLQSQGARGEDWCWSP